MPKSHPRVKPLSFLRARSNLLLLGAGMELIYLLFFLTRFPLLRYYNGPYFDMGQITRHSHLEFWLFLGEFAVLYLLLAAAWWLVRDLDDHSVGSGSSPPSGGKNPSAGSGSRTTLWLILGAGAIFGVTLTFVYPITANDIFSYLDQSLIMVQYHQNPISVPPTAFPHDPLMKLSGGWAGFGAPYGPLGLVVDALPTIVVRRNLLANLILLKLMFSAMMLISAYLVYQLLQHVNRRHALSGALLVAWNPLILFETSANGHNDIAMMAFVLLALLFMAEGQWTLGPALLMASALIKYASLLLLPLLFVYAVVHLPTGRKRIAYLLTTGATVLAIAVVAYLPFWAGSDTFRRALLENQLYLYSSSSVLHNLFLSSTTPAQMTALGRVLFVPFYLYALLLASRDFAGLLRACFLTAFAFLALGINNVKYWYAIWPNVLAAALPAVPPRLAALLMGYGAELAAALNIYAWTWLGVTVDNLRPLNNLSYLAIFVLPALLLLAASRLSYRRPKISPSRHSP